MGKKKGNGVKQAISESGKDLSVFYYSPPPLHSVYPHLREMILRHDPWRIGDFLFSHGRVLLDTKSSDFKGLLLLASTLAHLDIMLLLLKFGADVNGRGKDGETALHASVHSGCASAVRLISSYPGIDLDPLDRYKVTPLYMATSAGFESIVNILLDAGARPDIGDHYLQYPIHLSCARGSVGITTMLLKHPSTPLNARTLIGLTPLHFAAESGNEDVVKLLLGAGADTEVTYTNKNLVNLCLENSRRQIAHLLLCRGYPTKKQPAQ